MLRFNGATHAYGGAVQALAGAEVLHIDDPADPTRGTLVRTEQG